jgi:hypothetical protein
VAIYDATNSTRARRDWIGQQLEGRSAYFFLESICDDQEVILLRSKMSNR